VNGKLEKMWKEAAEFAYFNALLQILAQSYREKSLKLVKIVTLLPGRLNVLPREYERPCSKIRCLYCELLMKVTWIKASAG
jgi:hypothetical protein